MRTYNVGDMVRIKHRVELADSPDLNTEYLRHAGTIHKISNIHSRTYNGEPMYEIETTNCAMSWIAQDFVVEEVVTDKVLDVLRGG